jgi:sec-independent protein translocase protein TatC
MSFGDHLEELRNHLLRAMYGFLIGLCASFFVGHYVVAFIAEPVEAALQRYYDERAASFLQEVNEDPSLPLNHPREIHLTVSPAQWYQASRQAGLPGLETVKQPAEDAPPIQLTAYMANPARFAYEMQQLITKFGPRPQLKTLSATEAFMVYFKVCIITGFVLTSPWVFYQIWSFIAAGLYPHEKKYINYYLPFSLSLFLGGVAVSEIWIIPNALDALLQFNKWMSLEPDFRLNEWLSFAIWVPVIAGLCFQTPLVMLFLAKVGIFTADQYISKWRYAAFGMLILAAFGPTVDPISLTFLWGCMIGLYGLGILLVKWFVKPYSDLIEEEIEYRPEDQQANDQ